MSYEIAAVDRALALMETLADTPGLGVTELAERTGNTKSLTFRLLYTLEQRGFVQKDPGARSYSLGYRTLFLADQTRRQSRLIAAATPFLDALAEEARENAMLIVREERNSLCVALREAPSPLRLFAQVGRLGPLHAGGGPKVLLAHAPEAVRDAVLDGPLESFTATTLTDPAKLRRALDEIRRLGFTLSIGELDPDVFSMAAPVFDYSGEAVAALSVAGPVSRLSNGGRERLRGLVVASAERLSQALGHSLRAARPA
jgi:IclR family KDG regulon transcriptional repressor